MGINFEEVKNYNTFTEASDEPSMVKTNEDLELDQKQQPVPLVILSERPAFTQASLQETHHYVDEQPQECCPTKCECMVNCSMHSVWNFIKCRIPMLEWIQYYNFRNNIASDVIAGITVGIMHIPQGMAYAMLGQVPPVLGLYVSFFPVLVYFFLGTSFHISIGTIAIGCLMLGKIVGNHLTPVSHNYTVIINHSFNATVSPEEEVSAVQIAVSVCMISGLIQIAMGIFRLGSLSLLLSDTLISGFTTGATIHVLTSQVKHLFGLSVRSKAGILTILYTYIDIFSNIQQSNYIALIISGCAIVLLALVNECINARFRNKMKMPVPIELIIIIIATSVSYFLDLKHNYDIKIIGNIPTGLPPFQVPPLWLVGKVAVDSIAISVVTFTITLSMAMIFAKKYKYEIHPNQELFAVGASNVLSSFFSCFPCCASLSRSVIQESTGGKTQVASLVSCVFVLIVLLFVGPLFQNLPNCILAAIIVVALKGMFLQFRDLKQAWRVSILEASVWVVSFLAVVITDVDIGLGIAVMFSILTVIFRTLNCEIFKVTLARPYTCVLGRIPNTDLYLDVNKYKEAKEIVGVKIIHFGAPLYFANRGYFRSSLYKLVGINPRLLTVTLKKKEAMKKKEHDSRLREVRKQRKEMERREQKESKGNAKIVNSTETYDQESDNDTVDKVFGNYNSDASHDTIVPIHHIILDCSGWSYVDASGLASLKQIIQDYEDVHITIFLAACPVPVLALFERTDFYEQVPRCQVFPTIHDAVIYAFQGKFTDMTHSASESNF